METLSPNSADQSDVKERTIRLLEEEIIQTNHEVLGLTLELDNRIEELNSLALKLHQSLAEKNALVKQLEQSKQAAEAANRAKSDFLARMSHEIRTPMNLIMGMNALLLSSPLNEKQQEHIEISQRNVRRLLRLINGILDLSKVEAGRLTFEEAPFDLNDVLKECAATISTAVEGKGLQFEIFVDLKAPRYWTGDSERLQQVLLNLIGNSVKFTAQGKIELSVCAETGPEGQPGLRFEVNDSGCGVPPDKAAIIFEPFQQAETSMSRRFEGTGLGLAISKTLIEMMSGRIWLAEKSEPGARFVFTVFLQPTTEEAVSAKIAAKASAVAGQTLRQGTRVLLVEDNPENVVLVQAFLENLPLLLDFAENGVEAVEKRRQGEYDLVLMDMQMPIMDGYTATQEIRAWEKTQHKPHVPIVALTAHALSGSSTESIEAGCDGHLSKPMDKSDLVEVIAKFSLAPSAQSVAAMTDSQV